MSIALSHNKALDHHVDLLKDRVGHLYSGQKELEEDECAYCGSHVDTKALKKRIDDIQEEVQSSEEGIKAKNKLRDETEQIQRDLGTAIHQYDLVKAKFDSALKTLVDADKLKKDEAEKKRNTIADLMKKVGLGG